MTTATAEKPATQDANLPAPAPTPKPSLVSGTKVAAIVPTTFESAYRLATVVGNSGMAPKSYYNKDGSPNVEMICVAIMHGLEVGFTPMAALQSIAVINGMPTIWGDGLLGLVQASGLLEDIVETVQCDTDGTPLIATCRVKRTDRADWTEQTFSRAQAQKAGLWSKQGPWMQYPKRMLQMRARSWAVRDAFADVLRGLHSAEEASDMVDIGGHSTVPPEPTRAQFQAQATAATEPHHDPQTGEIQQQAVTDAQDHNATDDNPLADDGTEAEGWPLHDADGETVGRFGVTEWLPEFDKLWPGMQTPKDRRQFLDNNKESAISLIADADVPEQIKATLRKRFEAFLPAAAK